MCPPLVIISSSGSSLRSLPDEEIITNSRPAAMCRGASVRLGAWVGARARHAYARRRRCNYVAILQRREPASPTAIGIASNAADFLHESRNLNFFATQKNYGSRRPPPPSRREGASRGYTPFSMVCLSLCIYIKGHSFQIGCKNRFDNIFTEPTLLLTLRLKTCH